MKGIMVKLAVAACAAALCIGAVGCTSPATTTAETPQQKNSSYMSQVNGLMDELGGDLDSFVDAVSRDDLVNMRTQADNAYQVLDQLDALEAPDDLANVRQSYLDGAAKLREALDAYIDLYTEISGSTFDQSTYAARLAEVQTLYDEGVNLLKQADETAAGK